MTDPMHISSFIPKAYQELLGMEANTYDHHVKAYYEFINEELTRMYWFNFY